MLKDDDHHTGDYVLASSHYAGLCFKDGGVATQEIQFTLVLS